MKLIHYAELAISGSSTTYRTVVTLTFFMSLCRGKLINGTYGQANGKQTAVRG
jgi:hypothetical protein